MIFSIYMLNINSSPKFNYFICAFKDRQLSFVFFTVSMDIKQRQTFVLKLLNHITEPCMYKDIVDIGKNFKIEENVDLYTVSIV